MPAGKTYKDTDDEKGYTYLELYINSLVDPIMKAGCEGVEDSPSKNDFNLKGTSTNIEDMYDDSYAPKLYKQNGVVYLANLAEGSSIYIDNIGGQMTFSTISKNNTMELNITQSSIGKVVGRGQTVTFKII